MIQRILIWPIGGLNNLASAKSSIILKKKRKEKRKNEKKSVNYKIPDVSEVVWNFLAKFILLRPRWITINILNCTLCITKESLVAKCSSVIHDIHVHWNTINDEVQLRNREEVLSDTKGINNEVMRIQLVLYLID